MPARLQPTARAALRPRNKRPSPKTTLQLTLIAGLLAMLGAHPVSAQEFGFSAVNRNIPGVTNRGVTGASFVSLPGGITVPAFLNTAVNAAGKVQANGLPTMHTVDAGVGDFNGDGIQDIVAVSSDDTNGDRIPDSTRLTVFLGLGDGTFGRPLVFELVEKGGTPFRSSMATSLAVADIDLDGVSDIVVAVRVLDAKGIDSSRVLLVNGKSLMNTPPGAFLSVLNFDANAHLDGLTGTAVSVAIGRLTSDRTPDIAVALAGRPGGIMAIIRDRDCQCFTGPGVKKQVIRTMGFIEDPQLTRPPVPRAIAIGRSNLPPISTTAPPLDADLDIFVATSAGIVVAQNDANGGFSSPISPNILVAGNRPIGVVAADINNDNLPDVIALNRGSGSVSTFIARKGGGYSEPITSPVDAILSTSLSLFDFNNDGFPDLIVTSFFKVSVLTGNGAGHFALTKVVNIGADLPILHPSSVATGKFDLRSVTDDIVVAELGFPPFFVDLGGVIYVSAAANYHLVPIPTGPTTSSVVSSTPNPSFLGQPVIFTATVTAGESPAAGAVSFNDGGISIGKATLDSSGQATFTTSSLTQGSHNITVTFFHNSNFGGSSSATLTQTVNVSSACSSCTLTVVNSDPNALGPVASIPSGIFCPGIRCSAAFPAGTTVTLAPEVPPASWNGCDTSIFSKCTVVMNADRTVTVSAGSLLKVSVSATPPTIAVGQSSQLQAKVTGGAPPYSFSWTPSNSLDNATSATPVAKPAATTIYSVTVTDSTRSHTASTSVTVIVQ